MNVPHRRGFTLVELLVVIAIIGVLISISLPTLQAARESSRRMQCSARLARLGSAVENYAAAYGALPAGTLNPQGPIHSRAQGMHTSWIVQVLPYLDEPAAFSQTDLKASVYDARNRAVRQLRLAPLLCPSDPMQTTAAAPSNYAGSYHDREAPINADNNGLLFLNSHVRYEDITDGRAYTLLLGEKRVDPDDLGWMSGTRATLRNGGQRLLTTEEVPPPPKSDLYVGGFGSHHPNVVQFLPADGSVRVIDTEIEPSRLRNLSDRKDGTLLTWPEDR